jgi:hypothetical protein
VGRRGPDVGGEIAERRVLLVADRGDDWHAGGRDCADDRLVTEGKEILEAPATAREHDDVDLGVRGERTERGDDRRGRALALHPGLAHDDLRRGKAHGDRCHEIATGCGVRSGEDPDGARDARQPTLAIDGEEAFGGELPLQLLERLQVAAETEPFDRRRPEREFCLLLEDLGPTRDVDGLALVEVQLEALVDPACDGHGKGGCGLRVLQGEEYVRPRRVAPQLGDLALHPDVREPSEVHPDSAVEGRHGEDLAIAVDEVLDLRHRPSV